MHNPKTPRYVAKFFIKVHPELALASGSEINIFAEISSPMWRQK
jgi:hypothetical protein